MSFHILPDPPDLASVVDGICPECEGSGEESFNLSWNADPRFDDSRPCGECAGEGVRPDIVATVRVLVTLDVDVNVERCTPEEAHAFIAANHWILRRRVEQAVRVNEQALGYLPDGNREVSLLADFAVGRVDVVGVADGREELAA